MKLNINEEANREKGEPHIERLPERVYKNSRTPSKSVNEMLAEMRLKDGKPEVDVKAASSAEPGIGIGTSTCWRDRMQWTSRTRWILYGDVWKSFHLALV